MCFVLYIVVLKTILCDTVDGIKCHTKHGIIQCYFLYGCIFLSCPDTVSLDHKQDIFDRSVEYEINSYYYLNIYHSNSFYTYNVKQSIAMVSPSSRTDKEDEMGYKTDLSAKNTDIEINTNTNNWSTTDKEITTHDGVSYRISMCLWRGSLN